MSVASLELCRELYELSGWDNGTNWHDPSDPNAVLEYPRYDLGYLLRKIEHQRIDLVRQWGAEIWQCSASDNPVGVLSESGNADTPEDAACKLAIELFKQGALKKEKK